MEDAQESHSPRSSSGVRIIPIETPSLGDRTYLVHDGRVAFVVDPQRDIDRVTDLLDEHGVELTHVFETHIHNDYVTGGLALARATGAAYVVNGADEVAFDRTPITDRQTEAVGDTLRVMAVATPGHTFTHLSYVLTDTRDGEHGRPLGVFSGGSLLFGATGRPDLLGAEHTQTLVHHQHASAHLLAHLLHDETEVLPTHGFGSFCSATQSDATASTIGAEKQANPVLTQDVDSWVRDLLGGLTVYPAYYGRMAPANLAGPTAPALGLPDADDADALQSRIHAGEWVVDLRHRAAYAAAHAPGTLNFGLDGPLATYVGWLIPGETPLSLLGSSPDDVLEAQRELSRIGIDHLEAHATGEPASWTVRGVDGLAAFRTATFADLAQVRHHRPVVVLDVRRTDEHETARIDGALSVPLHELPARVADVPHGEVWVHCAGGYRASVAASILAAAGVAVVSVDDSFDHAGRAGLPLTGSAATA